MIHITPGTRWSGLAVPAIHLLAETSQSVSAGSFTLKSLKISWNFGITKYMMPVTIATAMRMTTVG